MANKGGSCPFIILYDRGAVRLFASNILHQITVVCIQICSETVKNNNLLKYDICNAEDSPLNADFKRLFLGIHEKWGL